MSCWLTRIRTAAQSVGIVWAEVQEAEGRGEVQGLEVGLLSSEFRAHAMNAILSVVVCPMEVIPACRCFCRALETWLEV